MSDEKTASTHTPQLGNWLIAGIAGIGTAAVAAVTTVRSQFFDDIKDVPQVRAHLDMVGRELHALWDKTPSMSKGDYLSKLSALKARGDKEFCTLMERHHFRSEGVHRWTTGILDRANSMSQNSRNAIVINSVITAAIAMGGTFMFLNNRGMRRQLERMEDDQHEHDRKGRAA